MDLESFRGLERLLVIGAGALAIVLGYLLFRHMPEAGEGEGKVKLPGGVSIYVSRVGPGVFFVMFGAAVVGLSLQSPLVIAERRGGEQLAAAAPAAGAAARHLSYLDDGAGNGLTAAEIEALELARLRAREHIGFLNGLTGDLAAELPEARRAEIGRRLRNAKLELVQAVWGNWGDRRAFVEWVRLGAEGAPPEGLEAPAVLFRQGIAP